MILTINDITEILKTNPSKVLVENAQNKAKELMQNILGTNLEGYLGQCGYFENDDVWAERNKDKISNIDLFARLLHREEMVFTAKGGAFSYSGLTDEKADKLSSYLETVRFNISLRRWIKEFALQAYRTDPMSVLFIEMDTTGKLAYPTYKSSDSIRDINTTGRKIEYCVFKMTVAEVQVLVPEYTGGTKQYSNEYFRVVDDAQDRVVKFTNSLANEIDAVILTQFGSFPGIISSDLIDFTNNKNFVSPLGKTMELARSYMNDRSIRDLSKKYAGFPKAFEPLLTCSTCVGTGFLNGKACPSCSEAGQEKGHGFKLRTRVSDIARFPMPKTGQTGGITDPAAYFGYVTPNIETWDKQDTALNDIESIINDTYWGTNNKQSTTGPTVTDKHAFKETATKTLQDLQPIYARLNRTADWAQSTENAIAYFIGRFMFGSDIKQSGRTYGRYYILETPDELMEEYLDMKTKSAPQTALFDVLKKYYHALYANDPAQLQIKTKLLSVEPFVHSSVAEVLAFNPSRIDYYSKMFYGEWLAQQQDTVLLTSTIEALQKSLADYVTPKLVQPTELAVPPEPTITLKESKI